MLAVFVALLWLAGGFIVGLFSVIGGEYNSQVNEAFLGMLILTAGLVAALAIANIINTVSVYCCLGNPFSCINGRFSWWNKRGFRNFFWR